MIFWKFLKLSKLLEENLSTPNTVNLAVLIKRFVVITNLPSETGAIIGETLGTDPVKNSTGMC